MKSSRERLWCQIAKKVDILKDLKDKKYRPFIKSKNVSDVEEGADAATDVSSSDHGYDYLLSMQLWSLTMEKVQQLIKEKEEKEREVTLLTRQSPTDLWRTDLDSFLVKWEAFEIMMDELESKKTSSGSKSIYKQLKNAPGKKTAAKKSAAKKKAYSDSEMSEEEESSDGFDDEMSGIEKVTKKAARPQGQITIARSAAALLLASIDRTDREDSVKLSEITEAVSGIKLGSKSGDSKAPAKKRVIKKNVAVAKAAVAPAAEVPSSFDFLDEEKPVVSRQTQPKSKVNKVPAKPVKKVIVSDDSEDESSESFSETSSSESDLSSDSSDEEVVVPVKRAPATKPPSKTVAQKKVSTVSVTKKSLSSTSSRETSPEVQVLEEKKASAPSKPAPARVTAAKKQIVISDEEEEASSFEKPKPKMPAKGKVSTVTTSKPTKQKPSAIVIDSESEQSDDIMVVAPKERAGRAASTKNIAYDESESEEEEEEDDESDFNDDEDDY